MSMSSKCANRGLFSINLTGSPFVIFAIALGFAAAGPAKAQDQAPIQNQAQVKTPIQAAQTQADPLPLGTAQSSPSEPETKTSAAQAAQDPLAGVKKSASLPSGLPKDLSPWGMFQSADIVVKSVMIGLALASVVTWTIALAKMIELGGAQRQVRKGLNALAQAESLKSAEAQFTGKNNVVSRLLSSASAEAERSGGLSPEGIKERATALLQRIEARAARRMTSGTGILASIGSTAPFVGLFGTVWGIMNSFIGISQTNTTNLAVVAPGIAEALLATASGLVAAIPAVIIYNMLARSIASYKASLSDVTAEVLRHLSRDLDRSVFLRNDESWPEAKLQQDWRLATRQSAE